MLDHLPSFKLLLEMDPRLFFRILYSFPKGASAMLVVVRAVRLSVCLVFCVWVRSGAVSTCKSARAYVDGGCQFGNRFFSRGDAHVIRHAALRPSTLHDMLIFPKIPKMLKNDRGGFLDQSWIDPAIVKHKNIRNLVENDLRLIPELPQVAQEPPTDY